MPTPLDATIDILARLVGFDSVSGRSTKGINGYIADYLETLGVAVRMSFDEDGERANVFATVGPADAPGGVLFNGHTDVVPVEGQVWASDPFTLIRKGDRLHGRGAVDMKGFLACVLGAVPAWQAMDLAAPIHIAFSYDEETGGHGMPVLLADMAAHGARPDIVIVGEPTEMKIVSGHKGGTDLRTQVTGLAAHASDPRRGVNAIAYAARLIARIEETATALAANPRAGSPFEPPYATLNVGMIEGGTMRNGLADACSFDWEIRPLPGDDAQSVLAGIDAFAQQELVPEMRRTHAHAAIRTETVVEIPPLDNATAGAAVAFICETTGLNGEDVVSFGTDGGYFSGAGFSTAVFGPGSISRAHKPDEYIEVGELAEGLAFLTRVGERLTRGPV